MTSNDLDFTKSGGLITVVTQDSETGAVLMVAHMDREAFEMTIQTGEMHYRSRTRGLWHKGKTSGNIQKLVSVSRDCDGDAILARVRPLGPACHTGAVSCFDQPANGDALTALSATIEDRARARDPGLGYTQRLLADRNIRLKKLGEETAELIMALADDDTGRATEEGADVLYHVLVALFAHGITLNDVRRTIASRSQ